ncbi:MAG TPA: hypothetical protein PKH09_02615, partial [Parvularculaceae bacterium]|nr:hypothetical protein [Parvularculaceae bacterium]
IAGFPTETAAMFEETLALIDEAGINYVHAFPFSPRRGTPAALMPQIDRTLIAERAGRLREAGERATRNFLESLVGAEDDAIVESGGRARLGNFALARLESPDLRPGDIARVAIVGVSGSMLEARAATAQATIKKPRPEIASEARL